MANAQKGEVEITLGGKTLTLKIGTAGMSACQEALSVNGVVPSLPDIFREVYGGHRVAYVVAFLWGALRKYHPEYTRESVADLLDELSEAESKTLLAGLGASLTPDPKDVAALTPPDGKRGKKANPQKAQATSGTGDGSISRPDAVA